MTTKRLSWPPIIRRAAEIVLGYDIPVTLRQLFYRLVMELLLPNDQGVYKRLSSYTADLRRRDEFPPLFDRGRRILEPASWRGPEDALDYLLQVYRRDRTVGQEYLIFMGVEKNALAGLLQEWFDQYGVPVLPLGGYSSEGVDRVVKQRVADDGRPAILIYAGDFDASGMDIARSFIETTDCWAKTIRVGLEEQQIEDLSLPVLEGKAGDSRAPKFIERHPEIHARHNFGVDKASRRIPVQVELDAVDPALLHSMFLDALNQFWDMSSLNEALVLEDQDLSHLRVVAERAGGWSL